MVPPAGDAQQEVQAELFPILAGLAKRCGLVPRFETGLFNTDSDYRVPDQLFCRPDQRSARGAEGAELVVEVRSVGDETYDKIDWYAERGVREVLIVHPAGRRIELLRNVGGAFVSDVLDVALATVAGRLVLTWDGGSAEI